MSAETLAGALLGAALLAAVLTAHVPLFAATGAVVVGAVALAPWPVRWRLVLVASGAATVLRAALVPDQPDESGVVAALLACGAAGVGGVSGDRRFRFALAGCVLFLGALVATKQLVAGVALPAAIGVAPGLAALAGGSAACVLAAPSGRLGALALIVAGLAGLARAGEVRASLADRSIPEAARLASDYRDESGFAMVDQRLADAPSGPGALSAALAVVRREPSRRGPGLAAARLGGIDAAVALGWRPVGELPGDVAVDVALAMDARGRLGEAVDLLRRQERRGVLAWYLAALAWEHGDAGLVRSSLAVAEVPATARRAPGVLRAGVDLVERESADVWFTADQPLEVLDVAVAEGGATDAPATLRLKLGPRVLDLVVPASGTTAAWPVDLPPGAYRLLVRRHAGWALRGVRITAR